eukprot:CAMPEP_0172325968 /NCGR_PEP_ID=MMETSP1058-20130122/55202_1 /TAXON_ID=83371 /ORGANISM="Detonula confervacea, Strain CCMP 353" /LENGTH=291 /DNA_ID=CAMNT_0013042641 /DNA_START=567 /DNA_END=1442 /DNA_ORIENTATION=+
MTVASDALAARDSNFSLPSDVVVLHDMQRPWHTCEHGNCRNIWEKVWRSWLWVVTNGENDLAEWFVKVDADTFLFPENMKHYVEEKGWSPDDHHYFGHKLRHTDRTGLAPIIAGAAVFFSRATVEILAHIFRDFKVDISNRDHRKCMDAHVGNGEELVTAMCLKKFNISADHALDTMGDELVSIGQIQEALLWNRTNHNGMSWYWIRKPKTHPKTGREMHLCCSDRPIAFHGYKDPQWLYKIENELYKMDDELPGVSDDWKRLNWINPEQTNSYFDRVRKTMKLRGEQTEI